MTSDISDACWEILFLKRTKNRALCIMMASVLCLITPLTVFAEPTKSSLQKDAEQNQSKLNETQQEIEEISDDKAAVEAEMEAAQQQLVQLIAEVEILKSDIERKQEEIDQSEIDYEEAKKVEERQYNTMRARIKYMYENGTNASTEYVDIILHAESLSDAINKAAYASKLYEYDRTLLINYMDAKEAVAERQRILNEEMSELEEVQADLIVSQDELNATIEQQRATVENFSARLNEAKNEAKAYQKKIEEDNEKIAKIVAEEKLAAQKKAEEEAKKKKAAEEAAKKKAAEEAAKKAATASSSSSSKTTETPSSEQTETASAAASESNESTTTETASKETTEQETTNTDNSDQQSESNESESSGSGAQSEGEPVSGGTGSEIASYAQQFVGNPYVPGGTSLTDGCDCSGFTQSVYKHFGYSLPRRSDDQGSYGTEVSGMENAQPGDIFYYVGHVGIYIGNGYIVHASTPSSGIKITTATYRTISSIRRIV